jgi:hypothetical protein
MRRRTSWSEPASVVTACCRPAARDRATCSRQRLVLGVLRRGRGCAANEAHIRAPELGQRQRAPAGADVLIILGPGLQAPRSIA